MGVKSKTTGMLSELVRRNLKLGFALKKEDSCLCILVHQRRLKYPRPYTKRTILCVSPVWDFFHRRTALLRLRQNLRKNLLSKEIEINSRIRNNIIAQAQDIVLKSWRASSYPRRCIRVTATEFSLFCFMQKMRHDVRSAKISPR
ncbi:hypothetical protein AVEN_127107-1 [Araneus ventricosus]|uniref:Uncharacterized protein n=1 Tax=Araneus ventricosus TaxID=182803 RepID=A0A4Y2GW82_ARAVE|nr:hypothetical protein AVEN_127107-1 [Araneus ventricosus]